MGPYEPSPEVWAALSNVKTWDAYGRLLQEVYRGAGRPSFLTVASRSRRSGPGIAAGTAYNLANGLRRPQRRSAEGFLQGCGLGGQAVDCFLVTWDRLGRSAGETSPPWSREYGRRTGAAMSVAPPPNERDSLREKRNTRLREFAEKQPGVASVTVFQLGDHTDQGYLLHVRFDRRTTSAARVLTIIRTAFEEMFPEIPYWGQMLTEDEESVGFGFAYIDHNSLFSA